MRNLIFLVLVGSFLGCSNGRQKPVVRSGLVDAAVWEIADAAFPDAPPVTITRQETFACDHAAPETGMDPSPFQGSASDSLVPRIDSPCTTSVLHRHLNPDGTTTDAVVFTGAYYFGETGFADGAGLVACASRIQLSPAIDVTGTVATHNKENVSVVCASNTGGGWSSPTTVAGPAGNEWAAWVHSLSAGSAAGEVQVKWLRDYSLFPFTTLDEGRPPEDGIYQTTVTASAGGTAVGSTVKLADGVATAIEGGAIELPDGTIVPHRGEHEAEVPPPLPLPTPSIE